MKKIIKIIFNIFKAILIIILLLFIIMIFLQRVSNNNISFFSYRLLSVLTGSMAPKYNIGDVLICKEVDVSTLKVGDDITYKGVYSSYKDKTVTHRIKRIEKDENGKLLFYTQGIATILEDPVVYEDQIYGKIIKKTYMLSKIYKTISKPTGFYLCIFIPIMFLIGSEIIATMVEKYEEKRKIKEE